MDSIWRWAMAQRRWMYWKTWSGGGSTSNLAKKPRRLWPGRYILEKALPLLRLQGVACRAQQRSFWMKNHMHGDTGH